MAGYSSAFPSVNSTLFPSVTTTYRAPPAMRGCRFLADTSFSRHNLWFSSESCWAPAYTALQEHSGGILCRRTRDIMIHALHGLVINSVSRRTTVLGGSIRKSRISLFFHATTDAVACLIISIEDILRSWSQKYRQIPVDAALSKRFRSHPHYWQQLL